MPIRGGSPPPPGGGKKKFRSHSPPPKPQASAEDGDDESMPSQSREGGRRKRKGDRRGVVTPLEIPSRADSSQAGGRSSSRRLVSPRATTWNDLSDTEDERSRQPRRDDRRGRKNERGSRSDRKKGGDGIDWQVAADWKKMARSSKKRRAAKLEPRQKEDDDRAAQAVLEHHFHQAHAMHEATLMDDERRKRFHSHQMVFTVGALLLLLPLASLSVFTGALILAFPVPGMIYGGICAAAAWHSRPGLLIMVVGGAIPMIARVAIGLYVLAVMTRQCRQAGSCEGTYAVGWFGLAGEMFATLVASVAATHHLLNIRKTRVEQETAVREAADEKTRTKGVAELKQTLRKTFKSWGSELELIFKDFDEDGNGMMDREELCKGLKTLGADFSDEQAGWLFDKIDVDNTGEIDYRTFASWFGTTKQAERAKAQELMKARQAEVYERWKMVYEQVRYTIRKQEQLANIRSGHGQWDKVAIEACFDEFDDGDGELEVNELQQAFEMLHMDPTDEEIESLLGIYDDDGSGSLDKQEFVRMMYEFIQSREPSSTDEEEEEVDPEQSKPKGPEDDGTYPPTDGVVTVAVISCSNLLAADSNGFSDPYIKLKMGANGNERKTRVMAKTLDPVFAQTFQLKLRRLPRRVGDQTLRLTVYDFDRLDSDDVVGSLELDMWNIFGKNWAQEIDQSWPLRDDYGDVDKSTLKRAADLNKEHLYGTIRLRLSFSSADYASDESFSDGEMDETMAASPRAATNGSDGVEVVVQEMPSSSEEEDEADEKAALRAKQRRMHESTMVL